MYKQVSGVEIYIESYAKECIAIQRKALRGAWSNLCIEILAVCYAEESY